MLDDIIELALDVVGELTEAAFSSGTARTRREKTLKRGPMGLERGDAALGEMRGTPCLSWINCFRNQI